MSKYSVWDLKGVPATNMGKWRSIEFELVFNTTATMNEFVAFVVEKDYSDFITIKGDGSIHPNRKGGTAREVCVSFNREDETIVRDVCKFLKGKAYVNKSCGTHVHFDMRGVKKSLVEVYGQRLGYCVPALKKLVPESRRANNFCGKAVNTIDGMDSRYCFVNMKSYIRHKTIEVRGHSGTLNATKILNWIKICERIMSRKPDETKKYITSPEVLIEHYKFNDELKEFINKRLKKLSEVPVHDVPHENPAPVQPVLLPVPIAPPAPPQVNPWWGINVQHAEQAGWETWEDDD